MNDYSKKVCKQFAGPILFDYVWWILNESVRKGYKKLYFLARDGYLLKEIAELMCKAWNIDIECRYLYCSRVAFRLPTYHLLGMEGYDLLFSLGNASTCDSILSRISLTEEEKSRVYRECGIDIVDTRRFLSRKEYIQICNKLKTNDYFNYLLKRNSQISFRFTSGYLKQEGLLDDKDIVIVDSGWSGSMQKTLRIILDKMGYDGNVIGYYFAMYTKPRDIESDEFNAWYFSYDSKLKYKLPFCNNLFELILSAPHGMTIGYSVLDATEFIPILDRQLPHNEKELIDGQIKYIKKYVDDKLRICKFDTFVEKVRRRETYRLVKRYMLNPTVDEVESYSNFSFGTEMTESDRQPFVSKSQLNQMYKYKVPRRMFCRFFGSENNEVEIFWPYGVLAYMPRVKRLKYVLHIQVWDSLRFLVNRR